MKKIFRGPALLAGIAMLVAASQGSAAQSAGQDEQASRAAPPSSAARIPPPPIHPGVHMLPPDMHWDDPELRRQWRAIVEPNYQLGMTMRDRRIETERAIANANIYLEENGASDDYPRLACSARSAASRFLATIRERQDNLARLFALSLRFSDRMSDADAERMGYELADMIAAFESDRAQYEEARVKLDRSIAPQCQELQRQRMRQEREAREAAQRASQDEPAGGAPPPN